MKTKHGLAMLALLALSTLSSQFSTARAQGTAFTYQGRLNDGAAPANGSYDLRFVLYDSSVGGSQQGPILTNSATGVSNGLFIVTLDFGNQFPGTNRFLEIAVRTNSGGTFTTLSPRQSLTPTPYAITAGNVVSGGIPAGTYGNAVTFSNSADSFSGVFTGNGGGITNVNAGTLGGLSSSSFWQLGGNNVATGQFLGSLNNRPVELWVNGVRGLRLEPTVNTVTDSNIVNVIGGSPANFVTAGVYGATISGGGGQNYSGSTPANSVASDFGVVGGGGGNQVQANALFSTVGGGAGNLIQSNASDATIGGGDLNVIQNLAQESTISGGGHNVIQPYSNDSTISGGDLNGIQTNSAQSTVGGGYNNTIQYFSGYSTIGGGGLNTIRNAAYGSTIGAGYNNTIQGGAYYSVISGGNNNLMLSRANNAAIGGGANNQNEAVYGTLGGGLSNYVFGAGSTLVGGIKNVNSAYQAGTLSGGQSNILYFDAGFSSIVGGAQNTSDGAYSAIGGGSLNEIQGSPNNATIYATIAGGTGNTVQSPNEGATISGGEGNNVAGTNSTVGGGDLNYAYGFNATVPGGSFNAAADYSFAAGVSARAINPNCFVWSDGALFYSSAPDQFLIHAAGGVGIGTPAPETALHIAGASGITLGYSATSGGYTALNIDLSAVSGGYAELQAISSAGTSYGNLILQNHAGNVGIGKNNPATALDVNGVVSATSFNTTSDRNLKENFSAVSPQAVLDKVAALPITRWNFKQDKDVEHLGPMAQDFHSAFGLGTDDKHIATVDEEGVALAAIQGLNQKLEQKLEQKETEITELKQNVAELKKMLQAIAEKK